MSSYSDWQPNGTEHIQNGEDFPLYTEAAAQSSSTSSFPASIAYTTPYYAPANAYAAMQSQQASDLGFSSMDFYPSAGQQQSPSEIISHSPSYSPAHSAAHSFDHALPLLINSGASGPSTISSAIPSPSMSGRSVPDWTLPQHFDPSIVGTNAFAGMTSHNIVEVDQGSTEKIAGFVGESNIIPSSQLWSSPVPAISPFPISTGNTSSCSTTSNSTQISARTKTIALQTGLAGSTRPHTDKGVSHDGTSFKSRKTPASATRCPRPVSPTLERVKGQRQPSAVARQRQVNSWNPQSPPALTQVATSSLSPTAEHLINSSTSQTSLATFQSSPFFSQFSGIFIPPLGSSCV